MKILFISQGYENLGLEYLSASLKRDASFEIKLLVDPCLFGESGFVNISPLKNLFQTRKQFLQEIKDFDPALTVFSVLSDNFTWAKNIANDIKTHTNSITLFGGIHPTSAPNEVIKHDCIDYICIGEGESSILKFAKSLQEGSIPDTMYNIVKEGFVDKAFPILEDVNKLPFPDKDLYYEKYPFYNFGYITLASRGCPYSCTYCANSVLNNLYKGQFHRLRGTKDLLAELKHAKEKYKPKFIHFTDESFNISKSRCDTFLKKYKDEIGLPFSAYIYPDSINKENAKILSDSGCFKVQMGIQNANPKIREDLYKRKSNNEKIINAIKLLKANNIFVSCDSIVGAHNETTADIKALCDIYEQTPPDASETYLLRLYPNTDLTNTYARENIIDKDTVEAINNGNFSTGLFSSDKSQTSIKQRAAIVYLRLLTFLPTGLARMVKSLKIHYIVAYLPLWAIIILNKLIKKPKYDIYTTRTFNRYKFFIRNK